MSGGTARLLAHPAFAPDYERVSLTDIAGLTSSDVLETLAAYHAKITKTPRWERKLDTVAAAIAESPSSDAQLFWDQGFDKSPDPCMHMDGIHYYDDSEHGTGISLSDYVTPEFWFYSFWMRRHQDNTMEIVAVALELADPSTEAASTP